MYIKLRHTLYYIIFCVKRKKKKSLTNKLLKDIDIGKLKITYHIIRCQEKKWKEEQITHTYTSHYHLEVQANPQKMAEKKPMLFLASITMAEISISIEIK